MAQLSSDARNLNWLVANFAKATPGVAHAMVVSADGLPVAVSERLDRPGPTSWPPSPPAWPAWPRGPPAASRAAWSPRRPSRWTAGFLFVMSISDGSCLAVLAASTCNVAVVAYEMTVLVARVGDVLTPSLRAELQAILPT